MLERLAPHDLHLYQNCPAGTGMPPNRMIVSRACRGENSPIGMAGARPRPLKDTIPANLLVQTRGNPLNGMYKLLNLIVGMEQIIHGMTDIMRVYISIQFEQEGGFHL